MRGYGVTANVNVPLNKRDKGMVAMVAIDQLKPYQDQEGSVNVTGTSRYRRAT